MERPSVCRNGARFAVFILAACIVFAVIHTSVGSSKTGTGRTGRRCCGATRSQAWGAVRPGRGGRGRGGGLGGGGAPHGGSSVELHAGLVHRQSSLEDGQAGLNERGKTFFLGLLGAQDGE